MQVVGEGTSQRREVDGVALRLGLRQILADSRDILVGREVSSAEEVLAAVREERFDVVVLDAIAAPDDPDAYARAVAGVQQFLRGDHLLDTAGS